MKIKITNPLKAKAKEEKDKLKGVAVAKMKKEELDALLTAICQTLGWADISGMIK